MISIRNISKSFEKRQVLNCPLMDFETAQVHGIIGLNGAGKTTFFNILSSFLKRDSGQLLKDDKPLLREDIAFLETNNFFYSNITGQEYLEIFPSTNKEFNLDNLNSLLRVPLKKIIETYSGGMKKKIALLAIIKQDKPIYIFDEPFNGLDLETNKALEMIIMNLRTKGKTIFISSHILSPLETVCDKIHLLQSGIFKKTYLKEDFKKIETELFADFSQKAERIINTSV